MTLRKGYARKVQGHLTKLFGRNQPKRFGVAMGGGSGGPIITASQVLFAESGAPILAESGQTILIG